LGRFFEGYSEYQKVLQQPKCEVGENNPRGKGEEEGKHESLVVVTNIGCHTQRGKKAAGRTRNIFKRNWGRKKTLENLRKFIRPYDKNATEKKFMLVCRRRKGGFSYNVPFPGDAGRVLKEDVGGVQGNKLSFSRNPEFRGRNLRHSCNVVRFGGTGEGGKIEGPPKNRHR